MTAPADLCLGHYDFIGEDRELVYVGHRGCNCAPERRRLAAERRAIIDGFRKRADALSERAIRSVLLHLMEDIGPGRIEPGHVEAALAAVEPGGVWEGGL